MLTIIQIFFFVILRNSEIRWQLRLKRRILNFWFGQAFPTSISSLRSASIPSVRNVGVYFCNLLYLHVLRGLQSKLFCVSVFFVHLCSCPLLLRRTTFTGVTPAKFSVWRYCGLPSIHPSVRQSKDEPSKVSRKLNFSVGLSQQLVPS